MAPSYSVSVTRSLNGTGASAAEDSTGEGLLRGRLSLSLEGRCVERPENYQRCDSEKLLSLQDWAPVVRCRCSKLKTPVEGFQFTTCSGVCG